MGNEMVKRTVAELDGFDDFTNEVEGEENLNVSSRVIQGVKIKFLDPRWSDNNEKDITGTLLTALGVLNVVNKWGPDNKPLETRILAPGEKFPNFEKLNAECDRSEWRMRFGKMVGPWSGQHCVYFIDKHYNKHTWPSPITTIGSAICVRELADQIKLVREIRGAHVHPVTELGHTDYPTNYGLKQRPYLLNIKGWIILGPDQTGALPAPDGNPEIAPPATGGAPAGAQSVSKPTAKEVVDDEIIF
jgi:hypothetical protein